MLFVVMSVWIYPKTFLIVLRVLAFACTGVALHVVLAGSDPVIAFALAGIIALVQACGFGGGLIEVPFSSFG